VNIGRKQRRIVAVPPSESGDTPPAGNTTPSTPPRPAGQPNHNDANGDKPREHPERDSGGADHG
jgi:hypothetical protein